MNYGIDPTLYPQKLWTKELPDPEDHLTVWLRFISDLMWEYSDQIESVPSAFDVDDGFTEEEIEANGAGRMAVFIDEYLYPMVYELEYQAELEQDPVPKPVEKWDRPQPGETYTPIGYEDTDGTA